MKTIKIFLAVLGLFGLQLVTASAATPVAKSELTSVASATTPAPQNKHHHRRHHDRHRPRRHKG